MLGAASIIEMANAFCSSQVLFASSDLGVFEFLSGSPGSTVEEVVAGRDLDPRAGRLLLDACVAVGLLTKEAGRYRNSKHAERFLVPGSPTDLSAAIRYNRDVYQAWGRLPDFVRSGRPVERPEAHLGEDPARTRDFVLAMHGRALGIGRAVVSELKLEGRRKLLDLGGGGGTYSALIARRWPRNCWPNRASVSGSRRSPATSTRSSCPKGTTRPSSSEYCTRNPRMPSPGSSSGHTRLWSPAGSCM